ncbi:TetR family transcriptional regulator [Thalassospira profundimaris]|uniref:TetR family transcriptional regulator n=1 Tax=Thalassospira profundimaris TaxID=502049 RepID=A0A367WMA7_9PROT|nr:TetR family transcriptional regulator [Thalassospira profundimaris]RCK42583.1 TetR family transcriptional regulator [Thalassospira profundimaris]
MSKAENARISARKTPKQARSADLVATILEAATQVLAQEGAQRFTTARVAERAGVSIGSLYQYFPNKAAILFRLQSDEWRQTHDLLLEILKDASQPPLARLRALVHAFVRSECDEADMRVALNDAAPLYRDAPEAHAARARGSQAMMDFLAETLPDCPAHTRELASELIATTLSSVGKNFSETPRSADEITAYSEALADMLCGYVASLAIRVDWQ